jgi:hypothetical protein
VNKIKRILLLILASLLFCVTQPCLQDVISLEDLCQPLTNTVRLFGEPLHTADESLVLRFEATVCACYLTQLVHHGGFTDGG